MSFIDKNVNEESFNPIQNEVELPIRKTSLYQNNDTVRESGNINDTKDACITIDEFNEIKKTPLCGFHINDEYQNPITIIRTSLEIIILLVIFIMSYTYFKFQNTDISLVPASKCDDCYSCTSMYEISSQNQISTFPLQINVKSSPSNISAAQYITLYAKWSSCRVAKEEIFYFNTATVHKMANVKFPFNIQPNTTWPISNKNKNISSLTRSLNIDNLYDDDYQLNDDLQDYNYYYSEPFNENNIPKVNGLQTSLSAGTDANYLIQLNYTNANAGNLANQPKIENYIEYDSCFELQCGVVDYLFNPIKLSKATSSIMEVADTTTSEYVGLQSSISITNTTVTGTCTGVIYGNNVPFFTSTNSIQQSNSKVCKSRPSTAEALSNSFANIIVAFGIMNFFVKSSKQISTHGYDHFWRTCGSGSLDA